MRHLGSIVLSLVLTALVYVLGGIGVVDWTLGAHPSTASEYVKLGTGMGALLVAGLLYAVLVLSRLSPLGPILAGLGLFGVAMWATFATDSFEKTMPHSVLGVSGAGLVMAGPVGALLAVPLIATIVSPRRWRRWANPPAAVAPAYAAPPPFPQPSSGPPFGSSPPAPGGYAPQPPAGAIDPTAAAWPAPATSDELTDPDATRRL
jgi:hypothetical protein